MRSLKCIHPTYTHTLSRHIPCIKCFQRQTGMRYKIRLFRLATVAELQHQWSSPGSRDPTNYQSKRQRTNWGRVSIRVKANSMALNTLLCLGESKEEIIKDLHSNQAGRSPCERAVTPLSQGRRTPVWLSWFLANYGNQLGVNGRRGKYKMAYRGRQRQPAW